MTDYQITRAVVAGMVRSGMEMANGTARSEDERDHRVQYAVATADAIIKKVLRGPLDEPPAA